jgi:GNAT superfamily N-acetyltransferase
VASSGYAVFVTGGVVVRAARPGDDRPIAEVSVASRRWSYRDLLTEAKLATLSVEDTTADFALGLAELPDGAAVFVAERAGRVVGCAYVLPSPDADVPAGTSELGSLYVTEDVAGTGVAQTLMGAALDHARGAGHGLLTSWVRRENGRARRFYEKHGLHPDGGERSGRHDVLPIEIHEIRYRMSLEHSQLRLKSLAEICVRSGHGESDEVIDAVGPETFTFEELVRLIARAIGRRTLVVHVPRAAALTAAAAIGRLVGDVVVTKEELEGLIAELVTTEGPATGTRALTEWLAQNAAVVGKRYASELSRHYRSPARTGGHLR